VKKLFLALLLFLAVPSTWAQSSNWSSSIVANPTVGTVLVDTGALPVGSYSLQVLGYADAAVWVSLERVDGSGAVLSSQLFQLLSNAINYSLPSVVVNTGEHARLRVIHACAATCEVSVSLIYK